MASCFLAETTGLYPVNNHNEIQHCLPGRLDDTRHRKSDATMPKYSSDTRNQQQGTQQTHPSEGVVGLPWMANMGATCSWGVEAAPKPATLCSISPKMQPKDHRSMALVYPPLDSTTCKRQHTEMHKYLGQVMLFPSGCLHWVKVVSD